MQPFEETMTIIKRHKRRFGFLQMRDILEAHTQFGPLNFQMVKKAMGPYWPVKWDRLGPGEGIFAPDEARP
jgi:hypothetical protein